MPKGKNVTKVMNRNGRYGRRCLGKGFYIDNDSHKTGLNNHDLIIAGSRGGKTGSIVYPQLKMAGDCSLIVTDTKRILHRMFKKELEEKGYKVLVLDFVDPENSCMYNPLDYVRVNKDGSYNELDIMKISQALIPERFDGRDPFWSASARSVMDFFVAYTLEALPVEDHIMSTVCRLYHAFTKDMGESGFLDYIESHPDSFVAYKYAEIKSIQTSDKTLASIYAFVNLALNKFYIKSFNYIFGWPSSAPELVDPEDIEDFDLDDLACDTEISVNNDCCDCEKEDDEKEYLDITSLGKEKTALFINISDTDHSNDTVINLLYTQILQVLTEEGDRNEDGKLSVPVRLIFDDFASGCVIPDFDKIISVVGSRDIWLSMCVQSISQLESLYSPAQSLTIRNNCDHIIYLGGNDPSTADYVALRAQLIPEKVLSMSRSKEYVLEAGEKAIMVDKLQPYSFEVEHEPLN